MCETYDIIDWKSCKSGSERGGDLSLRPISPSPRNSYDSNTAHHRRDGSVIPKNSGGSNSDHLVFPTLFYDNVTTETSIVTLPSAESDCWRSNTREAIIPDDIEQVSVYQKVANWVHTQKGFFRKDEELVIEDDDLAVIDPVDLFQRSILDEYLLIAEDDVERRAILRDLTEIRCDSDSINSKSLRPIHDEYPKFLLQDEHHYDIESIHELMKTHEYRFIREPKPDVELELEKIIDYGNGNNNDDVKQNATNTTTTKGKKFRPPKLKLKKKKKKNLSASDAALEAEEAEDKILFLGVPRLLNNYVVLNREGYDVKADQMPDLWLSPFEEDLPKSSTADGGGGMGDGEANASELEFLSSWFSDVNRTGDDATRRQTVTDVFEKLTVITVGSDDEVWQDAPEIPDWLDDGHEELELFNQPSRPLYYYRDRIKGCYRIIGVEDETVVLFSGNDDDTIFYTEEDSFNPIMNSSDQHESGIADSDEMKLLHSELSDSSFVGRYRRLYNRIRYGKKFVNSEKQIAGDAKNDSGIDEDLDENTDDIQPTAISISREHSRHSISSLTTNSPKKRLSLTIGDYSVDESFIEYLFVALGALVVFIALALYKNGSPVVHVYKSELSEEVFSDIGRFISQIFE